MRFSRHIDLLESFSQTTLTSNFVGVDPYEETMQVHMHYAETPRIVTPLDTYRAILQASKCTAGVQMGW